MLWSLRESETPDRGGGDDKRLIQKENCKIGTLANVLY